MVGVNNVVHDAICECFEGIMLEPCLFQPCFHVAGYSGSRLRSQTRGLARSAERWGRTKRERKRTASEIRSTRKKARGRAYRTGDLPGPPLRGPPLRDIPCASRLSNPRAVVFFLYPERCNIVLGPFKRAPLINLGYVNSQTCLGLLKL